MHYVILGGTGFVGRHLISRLLDSGHEVTALVRRPGDLSDPFDRVTIVQGDPLVPGSWQEKIAEEGVDVVVNLVGCPIIRRWTPELKQMIFNTRVLSTRMVAKALEGASPRVFICANAVGYYGDRGNQPLAEDATGGNDFLAEVCQNWQREAEAVQADGHRVIIGRFAPVLGKGGGLLAPMLPLFRAGLGGKIGNGKQWLSWIHVDDLCRAIMFTVEHEGLCGPVNMVSANPVTNARFTKILGRILHRPACMPVPAFALKILYGQGAEAILGSQRCIPRRLEEAGFHFGFKDITAALSDVCT